jgi:GNAT superfamily N-acetyltransferase
MEVAIRPVTTFDTEKCGRIMHEAFTYLANRHGFPSDFPTLESGAQISSAFINHTSIFGVVAEYNGEVAGVNFLDERGTIRGVGPLAVDPHLQERGIGRRLMEAVVERGRDAEGLRLLQDSFNILSISLYTSLGFDVKEPVLLMRGKLKSGPTSTTQVRRLKDEDLVACSALCRKVHGFDRINELHEAIQLFSPYVALRGGEIVAYASAPTVWQANHGVAETEEDMEALLLGVGAANTAPLSFLLPVRQANLFRWCLKEGLRVIKPMTLMTMGLYQEPKASYFISVFY